MSRTLDAQAFGSLVVIGGFAAAEGAAAFLTACPASPLAWYLNLELFRPFEAARSAISPLQFLFGPYAIASAAFLALATLLVRFLRLRLALAAIANLCFACAVALAYIALWGERPGVRSASILTDSITPRIDLALLLLMLASSFCAFAVSHIAFIRVIRLRDS